MSYIEIGKKIDPMVKTRFGTNFGSKKLTGSFINVFTVQWDSQAEHHDINLFSCT
jgi:hypothetical protein